MKPIALLSRAHLDTQCNDLTAATKALENAGYVVIVVHATRTDLAVSVVANSMPLAHSLNGVAPKATIDDATRVAALACAEKILFRAMARGEEIAITAATQFRDFVLDYQPLPENVL